MKRYLIYFCSMMFILSACTLSTEEAEPYGGQCKLFGEKLFNTTAEFAVGSANFVIGKDLQKYVWDKGYESIADWIAEIETLHGFIKVVDVSKLTDEEAKNVEYLQRELAPGQMLNGLVTSGRDKWYEKTYETFISMGAACDKHWD